MPFAYIILDRIVFSDEHDSVVLTEAEWKYLHGIDHPATFHKKYVESNYPCFLMSVSHKGYDNSQECLNDYIGTKVEKIDLSKITVKQAKRLLKL